MFFCLKFVKTKTLKLLFSYFYGQTLIFNLVFFLLFTVLKISVTHICTVISHYHILIKEQRDFFIQKIVIYMGAENTFRQFFYVYSIRTLVWPLQVMNTLFFVPAKVKFRNHYHLWGFYYILIQFLSFFFNPRRTNLRGFV